MRYVNVILPFALPGYFTYSVPEHLSSDIHVGKRIIVQFGKRKFYSALIIEENVKPNQNFSIKEIEAIIDENPIVNENQLKLWQWISGYYMCYIGEVYKAALPSLMKLESNSVISFIDNNDFVGELTVDEQRLIDFLSNSKPQFYKDIIKSINLKNEIKVINSLSEKNLVTIDESISNNFKAIFKEFIILNPEINSEEQLNQIIDTKLKRANKQKELLLNYLSEINFDYSYKSKIIKKDFLNKYNCDSVLLNQLIKKDILQILKIETSRLFDKDILFNNKMNELSEVQKFALNQINKTFLTKNIILFHGVTSSGKTEVYVHLINEAILKGKQILYLVPEIALTSQLIVRLRNKFGNKVGIYHSKYSDNIRYEVWKNLINNNKDTYQIIIGTRSSVYLPFNNLELIIVDEEHDTSYKQFDPAPRYNARDIASILASIHNSKVILGTATPSFESFYNVKSGKYGYVKLDKRYLDLKLPEIILVNLKLAYKRKQMNSHYSDALLSQIEKTLKNDEQVILFQNRRGFSSYIECDLCNYIPKCKYCDVSLTYHLNNKNLVCHYCGFSVKSYAICNKCGTGIMKTRGFGTEKIESELETYFPKAKIARLDLDSARTKKQFELIFDKFENREIDILVGTQMVTKGLDFENVGLVGVLNADNLLNFPDFRAFERSFQMLTQVSGRAGRKTSQGIVIIQTSNTEHQIIKYVYKNDFDNLYDVLSQEREMFKYPPFTRLIQINIKHYDINKLNNISYKLSDLLKQYFGNRVIGPNSPLISRIQNYYIKVILLKFDKKSNISAYKSKILEFVDSIRKEYKLNNSLINIDVDPM